MSKELVVMKTGQDLITFDQTKLDLIRKTVCGALNQPQFDLFMSVAKARGLDPVLNQIHAVVRKVKISKNPDKYEDRMTIQVGIDGFRLIAARTGEFVGCDETIFKYDKDNNVIEAKVTVYRLVQGHKASFTGVAYWEEFYPGDQQGFMWNSKPKTMLGKCAEAQALRKAFPNDLSGVYEPAEIEKSEEKDVTPPGQFDDAAEEKRIKDVFAKFKKLGVSEDQIFNKYGVNEENYLISLTDEHLKELNQIGTQIVNKKMTVQEAFTESVKELEF